MTTDAVQSSTTSRAVLGIAVVLAFVCGVLVAVQSRINGELALRMNDGFLAALFSFAGGLVLVLIALVFSRRGRLGTVVVIQAVRTGELPVAYLLGGAIGAFIVLSQALTVVILGVALFTTALVVGQTLSGLLLDRYGLGTMQTTPITPQRIVGACLALVAVSIAGASDLTLNVPLWWLALPFIGGLLVSWQQGSNGEIRATSGSPVTATFVNFAVGTPLLLIATLVHGAIAGWPTAYPSEAWLYLGGALGVAGIGLASVVVRIIGVLVFGLSLVAGQLIASVVVDFLYPVPGHVVTTTTVIGCLLTLVAVGIAGVPNRKRQASG
ncbi:MAG TPA: DMT family transporter [Galbitalea sp.]|jgi:transporter family-2 protein